MRSPRDRTAMRSPRTAKRPAVALVVVACSLVAACSSKAEMDAAKVEVAKLFTDRLVKEVYPRWQVYNAEKVCPAKLGELIVLLDNEGNDDPWGKEYTMTCGETGLKIRSAGPDGTFETADDIVSPRPHQH